MSSRKCKSISYAASARIAETTTGTEADAASAGIAAVTTGTDEAGMHSDPGTEIPPSPLSITQVNDNNAVRQSPPTVAQPANNPNIGTIPKNKPSKPIDTMKHGAVKPIETPRSGAVKRLLPRRARKNYSCGLCDACDNSRMVQCDNCDRWYHFTCVEVSAGIADEDWTCPLCEVENISILQAPTEDNIQLQSHKQQGIISIPPTVNSRSVRTRSSVSVCQSESQRLLALQLRKLEEDKEIEKRFLNEKYKILCEFGSDSASVEDDIVSNRMSEVEEWIQTTTQAEEQPPRPEPPRPQLSRLELPLPQTQPPRPEPPRLQTSRLELPLPQPQPSRPDPPLQRSQPPHPEIQRLLPQPPRRQPHKQQQPSRLEPPRSRLQHHQSELQWPQPQPARQPSQFRSNISRPARSQIPGTTTVIETTDFNPDQGSTPNIHARNESYGDEFTCVLNRSQLAARQAVSKDLPEFGGNPEDWPLFFSMFNSSTQMCGFSNEENMLRLRKCLRGKALEAVRCRLLHPSNVDGVISTLRMLYGRPETIIQAIIRKVRGLPPPSLENLETLVNFSLTVGNLCATIQACEVNDFVYNASLRYELVERLPPSLKLDWAKTCRGNLTPNLLDFSSWLYSMAEDASAVMLTPTHETKTRGRKNGFLNVHLDSEGRKSDAPTEQRETAMKTCAVCKGSCSSVSKCKRFAELSYNARWATLKELKLCRKCLRRHNGSCNQQKACGTNGCTYLHHPLLHGNGKPNSQGVAVSPNTDSNAGQSPNHSCHVHQVQTSDVLFRFVPVVLYGPSKSVRTFAFIDDGSELTLLEQSLADELGLKGQPVPLCLKWTGDSRRFENSSQRVNLQISGSKQPAKKMKLSNVRTVQALQLRPQTMVIPEIEQRFHHIKGLPIESYRDAYPRILIGVDHARLGHVTRSREGKHDEPIAVKTCLGWTVYGSLNVRAQSEHTINYHTTEICSCNDEGDDNLHQAMKNYFSLDSMGVMHPRKLPLSAENQRAQQILDTLTHRKGERYESCLLWKYDNVRFPDSRPMALRRWECLERRLQKDPTLSKVLNDKIADYISKGYIRRLTEHELKVKHSRVWYLPVFPVVNPNKPAKTRLVWDAAATVHGISLNSTLLKGPDLLTSLLSILIRFREFRVAVCGDVREMYHQVLMREEDQQCQRFLWGSKAGTGEPHVYIMQVMTFGACCSPSTAQYIKNKNAELFERKYPAAVQAIIHQHYVDDMLVSVESEDEAATLAQNVKWIHAKGGFEMRNWLSNSSFVLGSLNANPADEMNMEVGTEPLTEKILGMWWNTAKDCFTYKLSARNEEELLSGRRRPTKREVLRTMMLVYDPLGIIAHFLMFLKVLLQEIWRSGVGWDDEINDEQFTKWLLWVNVLPKVEIVEIPRCYRLSASVEAQAQLHTFVDASESGFAAVVYLRYHQGSHIECALVGAKTRVAPLRFLSIPRSELQAGVLGVRLANTIAQSLTIKVSKRFFYTDARDLCCWLNSDHRRYSQFVAFRISEILESTEVSEWHWIPSKLNVADEGTKWKDVPDLSSSSRWLRGPDFLWKPETEWPLKSRSYETTNEELRPHLLTHTAAPATIISPEDFSSWNSLLRRTSLVFRYVDNLRRKVRKELLLGGPLTRGEYIRAESYLYRIAQGNSYADEIATLTRNRDTKLPEKLIPKTSSLHRLCPFLDTNDVLRLRGRTAACLFVNQDTANPVILPREHYITRLIVNHYHQRFHHQNHETTVNELRQRYYIPRLKAVYRKIRSDCQKCKIDRAAPSPPIMADLPISRLSAFTRPFTYMGIDYFGPFTVSIGRRTEKRWGVLATCLTTRAIHLQIAHTLSTDSCIMALRNIMARRGVPAVICSDRGTNFQGAEKELKEIVRNIDQDRLVNEFTSANTEWRFNPPASPHMGGAWERLIRTVKQNLYKLTSSRATSMEVFENALIEIENVVNSRPLTNIPLDNDDSPVLTPNHFLVGSSNGLKPWIPFDDSTTALRNNWKLSQSLANTFWKQWLRDYLPNITRRAKWFTPTKPIEVNDIVIIADPRFPRNCWPKGRIIATQPGPDDQVRSATVQTVSGIYERPAMKIAVLDVGVSSKAVRTEPSRIPEGSVNCATSTIEPHVTLSIT